MPNLKTRFGRILLGTGSVLFAAAGVAACSSSSPSAQSTTTTTKASAPAPPWAAALGSGVTVTAPGTNPAPGHESPGAVVEALTANVGANNLAAVCTLYEPAVQAKCKQAAKGISSSNESFKNIHLAYIATDGDQALVGVTGTFCEASAHPSCATNTDPAAIFSAGKPFASLYPAAVTAATSPALAYSLTPMVEVGSNWYTYIPPNSI